MKLKNLKTFIFFIIMLTAFSAQSVTVDNHIDSPIPINTDRLMNNGNIDNSDAKARQKAFTISKPEDSIKQCAYQENAICKILLRERMPAIIKLPEDEWVSDWILGDELDFELSLIHQSPNKLLLKGLYPGVDTNLNIIGGSGLIYSFYILTETFKSKVVSDFIVNINTSTPTQAKIVDAKRFYKDKPRVKETLTEIIIVNIKHNSLHTALKKLLPSNWDLDIDSRIRNKDKLVSVVSDSKSRRLVITELLHSVGLDGIFYQKLTPPLLVVLEKSYVIK